MRVLEFDLSENEMEQTHGTELKKKSVLDVVKLVTSRQKCELPFFVADLADVVEKYRVWKNKLPRVSPLYAIKCNPDPLVLRLLVSLGVGFDCASKWEIDAALAAGCEPSNIIYAHPVKIRGYIRHASDAGVSLMTFDSVTELYKIKETCKNARLVIRFRVPDVKAEFTLNDKFGCHLIECRHLLQTAKDLGLAVVGTSFHVGGLCLEPEAYSRAIEMSREVFNVAKDLGFDFTLLDIGGGYPGHTGSYELFDRMCQQINGALNKYFPDDGRVKIIAEPGCYFVCSAFTLCTTIIGKKDLSCGGEEKENVQVVYFMNDGNYTSFCEGIEKYHIRARPFLTKEASSSRPLLRSKLWGWSCCSSDCIMELCTLPLMDIDDHILFENMGAYSHCLASNFNGFPNATVVYMYSGKPCPAEMYKLPIELNVFQPTTSSEKLTLSESTGFLCDDDSNSDICRNG